MFESDKLSELKQLLDTPKKIVITAHKSADGDSVGSSLALYHFLKKLNHDVSICHPDKSPFFYQWLSAAEDILTLEENSAEITEKFKAAEIVFALDYNHPSRIGDLQPLFLNNNGIKVMVDHHQNPANEFFDLSFSFPKICSTCEIIYELIVHIKDQSFVDVPTGEAIYCGIMTDTGSFRFPSTTARTHRIIAELLELGVVNNKVHESVFDTNNIDKIKLNGYALSEKLTLLSNLPVAYIALSKAEQTQFKAKKGDTEGLVNKALSIQGVKMAVFFKEDTDYVKISFRSKGDTYVNKLASENFEGGGHVYAAGGKFDGSLEEAIQKLVTLLPQYVNH
ncbi:bifunctional oligoribonuclease/PAP phosphatase NrnA [Putridiphycobacter roseus]|uniref:Bifunctional oligoribonuclease/PAP phosphatase NrnA n=1 Tax=Putridiphycobacter roseus TaxID=2219161 RepID=A0A2W1NJU4_9FLAO|nr:bifunctional oligoribonuclease/PAP phosphatase NrnA [Putridiphycobacter roseus]PZE18226.1 bifunctional oligoribonuclease/PAP phosphatase NrnA [Putridiphycobacter roseus]